MNGPAGAPPDPSSVAGLFPGYFALVMATGIIAVALEQQDLGLLADVFLALAALAYVVLLGLTGARLARHRSALVADLTSHAKGFAFLTIVAATNVLGSASAVVAGWWSAAWALWWLGLGLWVLVVYTTLVSVVVRGPTRQPAVINGTWFLLTVSTESVAVLGALHLTRRGGDALAFACVAFFLLGLVLYLIVMTLVFRRWALEDLEPADADPPAWIATGAVAITVLAGANLLLAAPAHDRLERLAPAVEAFTVLAWATAAFWFPLLIAIGVWRHVVRRVPLVYLPAYWSLVFPLGMFSAASYRMLDATALDGLDVLPQVVLVLAAVAWLATAAGLVVHLTGTQRRSVAT